MDEWAEMKKEIEIVIKKPGIYGGPIGEIVKMEVELTYDWETEKTYMRIPETLVEVKEKNE